MLNARPLYTSLRAIYMTNEDLGVEVWGLFMCVPI